MKWIAIAQAGLLLTLGCGGTASSDSDDGTDSAGPTNGTAAGTVGEPPMGTSGSATTSGGGVSSSSGEPVDTDDEPVDTDGEPRPGLTGVVVPHRPETGKLTPFVLDWFRIDAEEDFEPVRLSAPEQHVAGTGFVWGDWYAFVAVDDVEVGERSLYLNSLSAPLESAPTPYFDHFRSVDTHPNGTMVIALRIGKTAPFRSEIRVAHAPPLGSLSKSPPESTLLFEFDGGVTGLTISPSGDVFYFRSSGSWYAARVDGDIPVHLLDDPCTGRNGDVSVAFQTAGLVYACESTIDGSAVAGIVDPESAVVTFLLEDDPPGVLPLAPFLDGGLALWHYLNLEDSHRYYVTLISGETSVVETDELSFSHVSLSPDRRWVTMLGGSSEPPLEVHSLVSESVAAEFPELDPSTLWHPTQPVLFAKRKAPFGPGITRLSIRGNEVVELDTIPAGLPPDAQEVTNFELVADSEIAMATVVTSRARIWGRIDLTEANPTFTPLHDDSFEAGGRVLSFSDGLSAIGTGPDSESGQETLYLVRLNSEPRFLLETNAFAGPFVGVP